MKNEVIKIIEELQNFRINVNNYYFDSEYASFTDELLAGKIKSLEFYFLQMNLQNYAKEINEFSVVRSGEAISTLEYIRSSVLPEAKREIENLNIKPITDAMKKLDRLNLIDEIGGQLQATMTTADINVYLGGFGIANNGTTVAQSKRIYTKELLTNVDDKTILQIADELGLRLPSAELSGVIQLQDLLNGTAYTQAKTDFGQALQDVDTRPESAIGLASTTLESICKAILDSFNEEYPKDESLQSLQKAVFGKMQLSPEGKADEDIKRILGGLINVGAGIGTLRTKYSNFHGKGIRQYRLGKRHARLAVNALTTTGLFLIETYAEKFANKG